MNKHGGSCPFHETENGSLASNNDSTHADGVNSHNYCHFIRTPNEPERFKLFKSLPKGSEKDKKIHDLLGRLSLCITTLTSNIRPPEHNRETNNEFLPWENPNIPAGYTYLAQLVAHDLVQTTMAFPATGNLGGAFVNGRSIALDLETLYGMGPTASPWAFALSDYNDKTRTKFRLGPTRRSLTDPPEPPFRDIARASAELNSDTFEKSGMTEALLVDPRNDDNSNISQLTTVFMLLHNIVIDKLNVLMQNRSTQSQTEASQERFIIARQIVSRVYRDIIRYDLLEKLLHKNVYAKYNSNSSVFLDTQDEQRLALEFSHAAFRFGHAMVRPDYRLNSSAPDAETLNAILLTTSGRQSWHTPLTDKWIIQWSHFFDIEGINSVRPNASRRIGPHLAGSLEASEMFHSRAEEEPFNLGHRDLLRGESIGIWSVPSLVKIIQELDPNAFEGSDLLPCFNRTSNKIASWLRSNGSKWLSNDEIESLANDPPLFFFILFEAANEENVNGRHLGTLGSIIVAETVFKALRAHPSFETPFPKVAALTKHIFGEPSVRNMSQLLHFVNENAGFSSSPLPFL